MNIINWQLTLRSWVASLLVVCRLSVACQAETVAYFSACHTDNATSPAAPWTRNICTVYSIYLVHVPQECLVGTTANQFEFNSLAINLLLHNMYLTDTFLPFGRNSYCNFYYIFATHSVILCAPLWHLPSVHKPISETERERDREKEWNRQIETAETGSILFD